MRRYSIRVAFPDPPQLPGDHWMPSIVGTWKLLHATARDAAGAARPSPYGGTGLRGVKLVISDAHEGLKAAVAKVLHASWQRCRVHFMRNVLAHAGKQGRRVAAAGER